MGRLKAYTILEVTVVILMSGIVASTAFLVFDIANQSYRSFSSSTREIDEALFLKKQLVEDFSRSEQVYRYGQGVRCVFEEGGVVYNFHDQQIIRKQGSREDGWMFQKVEYRVKFLCQEQNIDGYPVDELFLQFSIDSISEHSVYCNKQYDAGKLMSFEKEAGL